MEAQIDTGEFVLVVDDFGVKYVGKDQPEHLITCIQKCYTISLDWNEELYCVGSLDWYYKQKHVTLSKPAYVQGTMHEY